MKWATQKIEENLDAMNAQLKTRYCSSMTKSLVFNRVRVLKSEGYAEDVAFCIAMKEHRFTTR